MGTTRLGVVSVAALLLLSCVAVSPSEVKIHAPRNWGNLPDGIGHRAMPMSMHAGEEFDPETSPWVEKVGERPQVYYYHNFLTEREVSHMISVAAPQMKRSMVVGGGGNGVVDDIRTSYGAFLRRLEDPVIAGIEHRISMATHVPLAHQEDIQVLRYSKGQKYGAHYDSAYDKDDTNGPRFRLATFYMYLSDVEEGGETAFPKDSQWTDPSMGEKGGPWSDCAKGSVAAKPKRGDAVLFYSFFLNGTMDPASMHTGCPVVKGIKWGAPVWIHVDEFRPQELRFPPVKDTRDPSACADYSNNCATWKAAGECTKNSGFMMDMCRKSCNDCEACGGSDWTCINRNRKKAGYLELDVDEMRWLGVDLSPIPEPSPEL